MKEETKHIIWSSEEYYDEVAMNEWWQELLEIDDYETTTDDLARVIGINAREVTDEQQEALETLLPAYRAKQLKRKPNEQMWYENVDYQLDCERDNLDKLVNGTIVCVADLGLWDGRRVGLKKIGDNIKDIFYTECEYATWYGDGKDIKCSTSHHDGSNYYLYRVADDYEKLEELCYENKLTFENVIEQTESLYPYVADVYGW